MEELLFPHRVAKRALNAWVVVEHDGRGARLVRAVEHAERILYDGDVKQESHLEHTTLARRLGCGELRLNLRPYLVARSRCVVFFERVDTDS